VSLLPDYRNGMTNKCASACPKIAWGQLSRCRSLCLKKKYILMDVSAFAQLFYCDRAALRGSRITPLFDDGVLISSPNLVLKAFPHPANCAEF
jgi:hypothetical protein